LVTAFETRSPKNTLPMFHSESPYSLSSALVKAVPTISEKTGRILEVLIIN
jgi:hypothetical protein